MKIKTEFDILQQQQQFSPQKKQFIEWMADVRPFEYLGLYSF